MSGEDKKAKPSAVEQFFEPSHYDDDEWGNIQLDGLSDEKLHTTNWSVVTTNKDPIRRQNVSQGAKKYWNSDLGKQNRSNLQKQNWQQNRANMQQALKDRYADGVLQQKLSTAMKSSKSHKEKSRKQQNKLQTPDGIFNSRKEAAEYYGLKCPTGINTRMKNHPELYYYIEVNNGATLKGKKK